MNVSPDEMQQRRRECNTVYSIRTATNKTNNNASSRKAKNMVNHDNLSANALGTHGVDVTSSNVYIGLKVRRGRHWNTKKWRDDIDSSSDLRPKPRVCGQVIGFTDEGGSLVGDNSGREYETDRITEGNISNWAVVKWDTDKSSIYPIGAEGLFSLIVS